MGIPADPIADIGIVGLLFSPIAHVEFAMFYSNLTSNLHLWFLQTLAGALNSFWQHTHDQVSAMARRR